MSGVPDKVPEGRIIVFEDILNYRIWRSVFEQAHHFRHSPASGENEESAQILTAGEYAHLHRTHRPT